MNKKDYILTILFSFYILTALSQPIDAVKISKIEYLTLDTLNMQTVVVTGTRSNRAMKDIPIQTQVISLNEIRNSGMSKLEDVLSSQLPGMEFHQSGFGISMSFQGLDARHILILVDGERLSGDVSGNIDFSKIPVESVERIEIVKGASSVLYGSNAMGATINIITKRPKYGFEGSAYYNFGGYNQLNEKETKQGYNADILNMTASTYLGYTNERFFSATDITYQGVDPYRMVSKDIERREYKVIDNIPVKETIFVPIDSTGISVSGWHSVSVNQKFEYIVSDKVTAKVRGGYFWKNRYDLGDYSSSATSSSDDDFVPVENYQGNNVTANVLYNINKKHSLDFSFHTSTTTRKEDSLKTYSPKQRNNISVARILYHNNALKNNSLVMGIDFNRETLNLDLSTNGYGDRFSYNSLSLYAQNNITPTDQIDILVGLRLDNYGFTSPEELFKTVFSPNSGESKQKGLSLTPQIAFKYQFDRISMRFNYAMGFRTPSLKERYMEYYQPYIGMTIVGNPNLVPETNNYISVSSDYLSENKKLYLSANIYANFFRNKIDTYHSIETDELIYKNTQKSDLYGFDLSSRMLVLKGWWLNASYSYSYRNESGPVNSAQYIFASPHTASLQTNYNFFVNNWIITPALSVSYYSKKTYEDMMPTIINHTTSIVPTVIEGVYEGQIDGYSLCNLSLATTYNDKYTFTAGVNNILNYTPTIASFNSALTPGITGYISIRVNF